MSIYVTPPAEFSTTRDSADFAGTVWPVSNATDMYAALLGCADGDRIEVAAGAVLDGQFQLRSRGTPGWVEIRTAISTAALDAVCPQGTRMTAAMAATLNLATLRASVNNGCIVSDIGASGYRLTAIIVRDNGSVAQTGGLIRFGRSDITLSSQISQDFVADRIYMPGSTTVNVRRGVQMMASYSAVVDSTIVDQIDNTGDSQSVMIFGIKGPYKLQNSELHGWGEGFLVGGANSGLDATNIDSVPSDLVIRACLITRRAAIKDVGIATFHKNGGEFKDCRRAIVENCVIENTWQDEQAGFGIYVKSSDQYQNHLLSGSQDIEIRNNLIRSVGAGIAVSGLDGTPGSNTAHRIHIHDNIVESINIGIAAGSGGQSMQLSGPLGDVYVEHNTFVKALAGGVPGLYIGNATLTGPVVVRNNIFARNTYGVKADGAAEGQTSLDSAWGLGNYTWDKNVMVGPGDTSGYPFGTSFAQADSSVGYADLAGGGTGYALAASSPYKGQGTDGIDIGCSDVGVFYANLGTVPGGSPADPPVDPPAAFALRWIQQPTNVQTGVAAATSGIVECLDQYGARFTGFTGVVTLTALSGSVSLDSGGSVAAVAGVATFPAIVLSSAAPASTALRASATSIISADSGSIAVNVSLVPTSLAVLQQPGGAVSGSSLNPLLKLVMRDQNLNPVACNLSVALSIESGVGTISAGAVASFNNASTLTMDPHVDVTTDQTITLRADAPGVTGVSFAPVAVTIPTTPVTTSYPPGYFRRRKHKT